MLTLFACVPQFIRSQTQSLILATITTGTNGIKILTSLTIPGRARKTACTMNGNPEFVENEFLVLKRQVSSSFLLGTLPTEAVFLTSLRFQAFPRAMRWSLFDLSPAYLLRKNRCLCHTMAVITKGLKVLELRSLDRDHEAPQTNLSCQTFEISALWKKN
ncbi:uncharacterized protein MELLADRAFT_104874 [Melampsora larici-populina 98AG31]|uniref:Uncharacterized protein n=1 Tax=Melampsora larici-populina (strain 98AG31 / pathotype 3-4-7) TaxID=747676 RepID=F4RG19_MELLP|nr:uncharacterized protein MELLADRAFT_104874 [Melampsora larici-populina 98AG31]EGG08476.1 hypothetical protein MELLADRAFT_104874 [Melampsora larici-populina 98AG31]